MRKYMAVGLGHLVGLAAAWAGDDVATAPATQMGGAPIEGVLPPVRVVPQLRYYPNGLPDPTGRFAVAWSTDLRQSSLRIVDLKRVRLAWILEPPCAYWPYRPAVPAFTSDGRWLALCSPGGGAFLDLVADQMQAAPWLKGVVPVFSPDDKLICVAANSKTKSGWYEQAYVDEVRIHDLRGKMVRSWPLEMNMVGRLSFSKDGQTLIVDGGTAVGLENRAGGKFTPSRQTINLKTGESTSMESPEAQVRPVFARVREASFDALNLQPIHLPTKALAQRFTTLVWDASTASLAVMAGGDLEGGVVKLWNMKEVTFTRTLGKSNNVHALELLRPGVMVGTTFHDRDTLRGAAADLPTPADQHWPGSLELVTLVQLPEGTFQPLPVIARGWRQCQPSPDGRHVAGLAGATKDRPVRLQVWDANDGAFVGEIPAAPERKISRFLWTADGRFLIVHHEEDKEDRFRWEFFTPDGKSVWTVPEVTDWTAVFSPSGTLVAVQLKGPPADAWTDTYRTSVQNSRTAREVATIPGTTLPAEVCFAGEDRLLIAGRRTGDMVRLIRISDQKVLWETKAIGGVHKMSCQPDSIAVVVHCRTTGADVLSIKDGRRLPGGDDQGSGWYNPTLLRDGRLALDPLCDSSILRLKETATGRTVATLAAFVDPEWIIYTPDGLWTGSPKALDWVAFYRGAEPLAPEQVAALRQPRAVQARLATAFR